MEGAAASTVSYTYAEIPAYEKYMTSKCSLRVVFSDFWSKEKIISSNYRTYPTTKTQCILCNTILAIELYLCKNKSCIELERWPRPRPALARYSIAVVAQLMVLKHARKIN